MQSNTEKYVLIVVPGLSTGSSSLTTSTSPTSSPQDSTEDPSSSPATTRRRRTSSPQQGNQLRDSTDTKNKHKNKDTEPVQGDFLRYLPNWLEDFTENLKDDGVLATRDTPASTSRASDSEHPRKAVSGKHCIFMHIPKDRNCVEENQDYKSSLQETHWCCSTSSRKLW